MESLIIGLRAQDFHESLKTLVPYGPRDVGFKRTMLIGKAAALAMHLRGLLFVSDYTLLEYAASSLGISSTELPIVLHELECVSFLSIVKSGEEIKRIDLRIPEFRSGYQDLGERWQHLNPTETEQAGVLTLDRLYGGPVQREVLKSDLGLAGTTFSTLVDVMSAGQLLAEQTLDGEPIIYTPLAVDGNANAYLQWAKQFPTEVQRLLASLHASQGIPVSFMQRNSALNPAVSTGVLMPVEVNGVTGTQRFIFSPTAGLRSEERPLLHKARAIVSCVRYGQHFPAGRAIFSPRRILETLRTNKRFKQGHPDLFHQYSLLAENLIGHPIDEGNGRWNFQIDDTDENMRAIQIAIEMLEMGESPSAHIDADAQRAISGSAGFQGPVSVRPKMALDPKVSPETRAEIVKQMFKLARGMSSR